MCIAISKMKGNKLPTEEALRNICKNNPDGAGFAFNLNGRVHISKGFMTAEELIAALKEADEAYDLVNRGVLIHSRIKTHGKVSAACCHPFPLSSKMKKLRKASIDAGYAIIHNGIISLTTSDTDDQTSDTMAFIANYLTHIASNKGWFDNKANFELIEKLIGSKMAILNGEGEIHMTSGFTKDADDGNYYSNESYKSTYHKYYYTSTSLYSDDYWKKYYGKYKDYRKDATPIDRDDRYYDDAYDDYYGGGWYSNHGYSNSNKENDDPITIKKTDGTEVKIEGSKKTYYNYIVRLAKSNMYDESYVQELIAEGFSLNEIESFVMAYDY